MATKGASVPRRFQPQKRWRGQGNNRNVQGNGVTCCYKCERKSSSFMLYTHARKHTAEKSVWQPLIQSVFLLKNTREVCHIRDRSTSTTNYKVEKKKRTANHSEWFSNNEICVMCRKWALSTCKQANELKFWLSWTCRIFITKRFCPLLVTCINDTCLNSLSACKTPVQTLYQSDCNISIMARTYNVCVCVCLLNGLLL